MRGVTPGPVLAAAALAVAGAAGAGASGAGVGGQGPEPRAKNLILLVGDGMGASHIAAARIRYYGAAGRLQMERLSHFGTVTTYSVEQNSSKPDLVTDSAAAATAWASGVKTYNNALGKDAWGRLVPTLMEEAKAAGMRTGLVSTAEITDATPAAMVAHVSRRACQGPDSSAACREPGHGADKPIAEQIAGNQVADMILGGGLARFEPDDQARMERHGYRVLGDFGDPTLTTQTPASQRVATRADLGSLTGPNRRVIGLFNRGHMTTETYKRQHPGSREAREPSLAELTAKTVELLADSDQGRRRGFLLQVEGALIDERSHANDAAQTLEEIKAFDDAVRIATDFARREGNTLVVVTADHETGGFAIVPKGSSANFAASTFRSTDDPPGVADGSQEATLWLTYLSGNHTGADVHVYASGPGSGQFDGPMDNTVLHRKVQRALRSLQGRQGPPPTPTG